MRFDKLLTALILLIASISFAAASPAELTVFPGESNAEINGFAEYQVTVENVGTVKDVYSFSSKASEVDIRPVQLSLEPGERDTVHVWYNPEVTKQEGTYTFPVTATSRATGDSYTVEPTVTVLKDHEVEVSVEEASRTACLGENVEYTLSVTNDGTQREEFSLSTDLGQLSANKLNLARGETKKVNLVVSSDRPVNRSFNVEAASTTSYTNSIQPLDFQSVVCYDSEVSITPETQQVPAFTAAEYEVTVRNTGTKADEFSLSTSMGELEDTNLSINGRSSESTTLSYVPSELGTQNIVVTSQGQSESSATANARVFNSMDLSIGFEQESRTACEGETVSYTLNVKNTGEAEETYSFSSSRGNLSRTEGTLEPGEVGQLELTVDADRHRTGNKYSVKVTGTASTFDEPSKTATASFSTENCWDLGMNVVPTVASAGENRSVIYEIKLDNPGTRENTYQLTSEGPEWISISPSNVTVEAGGSETAFMYAGIPFEKKGTVTINVTGEGEQVERSQTVKLAIGEDVESAIRDDRNRITGRFTQLASEISSTIGGSTTPQKVAVSLALGLALTAFILYSEW